MKPFQETQLIFTEYLRRAEAGENIGEKKIRRQEIYRDLVYKNISQCLADVFPMTNNIIPESDWEVMVREFINTHRAQTPYFLEIGQEFLSHLINTRKLQHGDHPFLLELAHFEWIQLAVDIADINFPAHAYHVELTQNSLWSVSPLAIGLSYVYPVHLIDECFLPNAPSTQPTHLFVYRNRNDDVKVLETDNIGLRVVQLLQTHESSKHSTIIQLLSQELDQGQQEALLPTIHPLLCQLAENEIIFYH